MINLETLGLSPKAPILSVAIVAFEPSVSEEQKFISNEIKDYLYCNVHLTEQILKGAEIEQETLDWWKAQPIEVQQTLYKSPINSVLTTLSEIYNFIFKYESNKEKIHIWSQGIDVDIALLRNLFFQYLGRGSEPWDFHNVKDSRTFINLTSKYLNEVIPELPYGNSHSAIDDALRSAFQVTHFINLLNSKTNV